jgi:Cu+-exporting ATPase
LAYVREIAHTGEAFPRACQPGDRLLAGSRPLDGDLILVAERDDASSALDDLADRLSSALARPSRWQREADRWMVWFVPGVLVISAGTFGFWLMHGSFDAALFNALAVLLVACPCALGIGVPVAVWNALRQLSAMGIAPGSPDFVERLAHVTNVVFDKTGTLTEDAIYLREVVVADGEDEATLLRFLALIEGHFDHPVALPFGALLRDYPPRPEERLCDPKILPGRGVSAIIEAAGGSVQLMIGNAALAGESCSSALSDLRRKVLTEKNRELFIFVDGRPVGMACLQEHFRPSVGTILAKLRALSLSVEVMTGDISSDGAWPGMDLPIATGLSSSAKAEAVRRRENAGARVLFIGDGMNDSEAMAAATVAIALAHGDCTARSVSGAELSSGTLASLPSAIILARQARRKVRRILSLATGYNLIGIGMAATGLLHPVAASLVMFASSLTVLSMALRQTSPASSLSEPRPLGIPT